MTNSCSDIASRLLQLKERINEIALAADRNPKEITLVAVSKNRSPKEILEAYEGGCRHFGENRVLDALDKISVTLPGVFWHFIGMLQTKKINKVLGKFALVHSIDDPQLAETIALRGKSGGHVTPVLLQVNVSGEASKQGLSPEEWIRSFERVVLLPGIEIQGLMTMAPLTDDEGVIRKAFAGLRELRDTLQQMAGENISLCHLSMGMSNDYHHAIAEGATILRIGSAIFGK